MTTKDVKYVAIKKVYISDDGKEFDTESECIDYEKRKNGTRKTCQKCNGRGQVREYQRRDWDPGWGHNELITDHDTCPDCHGRGYLDKKEVWE